MRGSILASRPRGNVDTQSFTLRGGLNLVDAPLTIPEGMCLSAVNYELLPRDGYRRVDGFERYDGQIKPSDSSYWILNYDNGIAVINEGDLVTGLVSGETGVMLIDQVGTVSAGYLVLTKVGATGFTDGEALQVAAATKADADGTEVSRGAPSAALDSTYSQDAIETQRTAILRVGSGDGSGIVRGVHIFQGDAYAFRDNSGATECLMYKATTSGWALQALGNRLPFTDGGAGVAYVEGEVITGTASGASATVNRVVLQSGSWGTDAVGYLIIGTVTSGPFQAEATTGSTAGAVPIDSAEIANTLVAGGRFEFANNNFFGSTVTQRMYGVDGVSTAFEYDGTVFVPILTGNTVDKPVHIEINEAHLMLSFLNGSLQNSATGTPYVWAGGGAAEIGCGDDIVGLQKEVGSALIVLCRNRTFALHGKNTVDVPWDLKILSSEAGAIEWTVQRVGLTRYLDDRGFVSLEAVQVFGDFNTSTYSEAIEPFVTAQKEKVTASMIVKAKTQLRTFFNDGTGIIATFEDKKLSGFTTVIYHDQFGALVPVRCTANGEDSNGSEFMLFGSDDGYLFQADSGTSFDGGNVEATFALTYTNLNSPAYDKAFKKVTIEAAGTATVTIAAKFDYSGIRSPTGGSLDFELTSGEVIWNEFAWNIDSWTAEDISQIEKDLDGVGRNIALQVSTTGIYSAPHTLYSVTYHFIYRKLVR